MKVLNVQAKAWQILSLIIAMVLGPLLNLQGAAFNQALAAGEKALAQSVEVNVDGVILTETKGPNTLFVTILDVAKNKNVIRQEVPKNGKSTFKGLVPGEYMVRGESYDGATKATLKTEGKTITITDAMFYPQTPTGLTLSTDHNKDTVKLTAFTSPIAGDETNVYFRLYSPDGGLVKELKTTEKKDQYYTATFSLKRDTLQKGMYRVTAQSVKYGNESSTISEEIEAIITNGDPKPTEPEVVNLQVNAKGFAEVKAKVDTKSNFYYIYNASGTQVVKKTFALKDMEAIVTDELPAGSYKLIIEAVHDKFKTISRSAAKAFVITEAQAAPPAAGAGINKISVGAFREYQESTVLFRTALPFYSKEGKYLVQVISPAGKEIARAYTKESKKLALAEIKVPVDKLTETGTYTFKITGEKFQKKSAAYAMELQITAPLDDLFWAAATQK